MRSDLVFNGPRRQRRASNLRIVKNEVASEATLLVYDIIDFFGVNAEDFVNELRALEVDTIHARINSPGGAVFDGIAIANALREHDANVIVHVDGLAASIASIIAMAGDEVRMADNAFLMIHDPWTFTSGNSTELRKQADLLDKVGGSLVNEYVKATGSKEKQVRDWMTAETWFDAKEALDAGFIDSIETTTPAEEDVSNSFDLSMFKHAPAALAGRKMPPTARDAESALRDAGFSRSEAKAIVASGLRQAPRDVEPNLSSLLDAIKNATPSKE